MRVGRDRALQQPVEQQAAVMRSPAVEAEGVGSGRGAVSAFRLVRFPDPPTEPGVHVSAHRALHRSPRTRSSTPAHGCSLGGRERADVRRVGAAFERGVDHIGIKPDVVGPLQPAGDWADVRGGEQVGWRSGANRGRSSVGVRSTSRTSPSVKNTRTMCSGRIAIAAIAGQDPRAEPLALPAVLLDTLVVHARRAQRDRARPDRHHPDPLIESR